MLHFAVSRGTVLGPKSVPQDRELGSTLSETEASYIICDARAGGGIIQHSSRGFERLFGIENSQCKGRRLGDLLSECQSRPAFVALAAASGLSEVKALESLKWMSKASEDAMQSKPGKPLLSLLVIAKDNSKPVVYELSWQQKTHPALGWAYHVGMQRDVSKNISAVELLGACTEQAYARMCEDWATKVYQSTLQRFDSWSDDLHAVAEQMWKDELAKGIKPKSARRTEADTSSVWSRSTASTLASRKSSTEHKTGKGDEVGTFHLGALLNRSLVETEEARVGESDTVKHDLQQSFWSMSEDESNVECLKDAPCPPDVFQVTDPVKHIDKSGLGSMKTPFVIAAPTVKGCPIALRSAGFMELEVAQYIQLGSDVRDVLRPSVENEATAAKVAKDWKKFCEPRNLWDGGAGICLIDGLNASHLLPLPASEFAFAHQIGNSPTCFVYAKHVELDDCPFVLACIACPGTNSINPEVEVQKLSTQVDEVIFELASRFFYFAPIRRQKALA